MSYPSAKSWLGASYFRLLTWISPKHVSHGLPVWTPLSTGEEGPLIYERLNEALNLLKTSAPARYDRVVRSLKGFLILGPDSIRASYDPEKSDCRRAARHRIAAQTTAAVAA